MRHSEAFGRAAAELNRALADPDQPIAHRGWREAVARLLALHAEATPLTLLIGERGSGKSRILREMQRRLTAAGEPVRPVGAKPSEIVSAMSDGTLLVDDADSLDPMLIEGLHAWPQGRAILAATPVLLERLGAAAATVPRVELSRLSPEDVSGLLKDELEHLALPSRTIGRKAAARLHQWSGGAPRTTIALAAAGMATLASTEQTRLRIADIDRVAGGLGLPVPAEPAPRSSNGVAMAGAVVVAIAFAVASAAAVQSLRKGPAPPAADTATADGKTAGVHLAPSPFAGSAQASSPSEPQPAQPDSGPPAASAAAQDAQPTKPPSGLAEIDATPTPPAPVTPPPAAPASAVAATPANPAPTAPAPEVTLAMAAPAPPQVATAGAASPEAHPVASPPVPPPGSPSTPEATDADHGGDEPGTVPPEGTSSVALAIRELPPQGDGRQAPSQAPNAAERTLVVHPALPETPMRLVVAFPSRGAEAAAGARAVANALQQDGYPAAALRPIGTRPGHAAVLYFFAEDQDAARTVSRRLGGALAHAELVPIGAGQPWPEPGTIEVVLSAATDAAR